MLFEQVAEWCGEVFGRSVLNLIEQLGGYAQAKALRALPAATYDCGIKFNRAALENAMLQYRRQHNIFEVGDKVVCKYEHTHLFGDVVLEIAYFRDDLKGLGDFVRFTNGNDFNMDALRHATDAEIKAGKRLEVS